MAKGPDYKVEYRAADELKPYPRNARTHSEDQIAEIAESIKTFGFTNPVLADEFIRAGHGRVRAALRLYSLGYKIRSPGGAELPPGAVPVIDCSGWTDDEKKAYVLVDNKIALNAAWDDELLRLEIGELQSADVDLLKLGFSSGDLEALFKDQGGDSAEPKEPKQQNTIIQFNIVFDDAEQQQAWFNFMRRLKGIYPDDETLGQRLAKFVQAVDLEAL